MKKITASFISEGDVVVDDDADFPSESDSRESTQSQGTLNDEDEDDEGMVEVGTDLNVLVNLNPVTVDSRVKLSPPPHTQ